MSAVIPTFHTINELHHACLNGTHTHYPDFHVIRHERVRTTCRVVMPAHRCAFYQVGFDENADYELVVNGQRQLTQAKRLSFAAPGHTLSWVGGTGVWAGATALFTAEFVLSALGNEAFLRTFPFFHPRAHVSLALSAADEAQVRELFQRLLYETETSAAYHHELSRHYLLALLHLARRLYDAQQPAPLAFARPSRAQELATAFEALVETHFLTYTSIRAYADQLCVTPDHLNEAVRATYGTTARELVQARRLREARVLLRQTGLSVGEVAQTLHFASAAHFSRFFRAQAGCSPRHYRQEPGFGQLLPGLA